MSETAWVVIFVATIYGGFYYLAYRAEKELREKAKTAYGDKNVISAEGRPGNKGMSLRGR